MSEDLIGVAIGGRYRLARTIGGGGMGAIYAATDETTGGQVAVKVINPELVRQHDIVARFEREARTAGAVRSDNIVHVSDAGTDPALGRPYIVMELLAGEDLQQLTRRLGPLSPDAVTRVAAQACAGLRAAHAAGVVHRDVKPANIFLDERGGRALVVKVCDFGIAKMKLDAFQHADEGGLTRTGTMLGSPYYMSPEQAQGLRTVDHRTDLWSLGVVMYKVLVGRTPHNDAETVGRLILAICSTPAPSVRDAAPWVSPGLAAVIARALRVDPADRYASADEMLEALRALLPEGDAIDRAALVPISPEQRALLARGVKSSHPVGSAKPTEAGVVVDRTVGGDTRVEPITAAGRATRRQRTRVVALAPLALAAGAALWWRTTRDTHPATLASDSAPHPLTASAPPPAPRLVSISVVPPDASVSVDEVDARVDDGTVTVSGAVGSVHRVRLRAAGRELTQDVVITEQGVLPARVALEPIDKHAPAASAEAARPRPLAARGVDRQPATVKPPPPASSGLGARDTFE